MIKNKRKDKDEIKEKKVLMKNERKKQTNKYKTDKLNTGKKRTK